MTEENSDQVDWHRNTVDKNMPIGAEQPKQRWIEGIILTLLCLSLICLGFMTFHPWLLLQNSDGATFYILAVALKTGQGYHLLSLPDSPPVFNFTPVWPIILALLMTLMNSFQPEVIVSLSKWVLLAFFTASLFLFYRGIRPHVGISMALAITLFLAVNASVHRYMGDLLADIPYLFFSLLALGAWIKRDEVGNLSKKRFFFLSGLIFLAMAMLTRPVALALGMAAGLVEFLIYKRPKNAMAIVLVCFITFGGWSFWEHHYRTSHRVGDPALQAFIKDSPVKLSFLKYFTVIRTDQEDENVTLRSPTEFIRHMMHRSEQYGMMITHEFWPKADKYTKWLLFAFTVGLLLLGCRKIFEKFPIIPLYTMIYLFILFSYPYVSARYLIPIMPFLALMFFTGLIGLMSAFQHIRSSTPVWIIQQRSAAITTVIALLSLGVQLGETSGWWVRNATIHNAQQGPVVNTSHHAFYDALVFLHHQHKKNAQKSRQFRQDFILITRKPEIAFYYSGVKAIRFPFYKDGKRLFLWMKAQQKHYAASYPGGVYILEDQAFKESKNLLTPVLQSYHDRLTLVYEDSTGMSRVWHLNNIKKF